MATNNSFLNKPVSPGEIFSDYGLGMISVDEYKIETWNAEVVSRGRQMESDLVGGESPNSLSPYLGERNMGHGISCSPSCIGVNANHEQVGKGFEQCDRIVTIEDAYLYAPEWVEG